MRILSATDLAIAVAAKAGSLRIVERVSRLGGVFAAIEDARGVIEVHNSTADAHLRIASVTEAAR
jgi:hypothetical protein